MPTELAYSIYRMKWPRRVLRALHVDPFIFGWVWPFMYLAGALFFTRFEGDPFLWRSFNPSSPNMAVFHRFLPQIVGYSNHHTLNLFMVGGLAVAVAVYGSHRYGWPLLKAGMVGTYASVLVLAIHEGYWWVASVFAYDFNVELKWFLGVGNLIAFGLLMLTIGLGLYTPRRFLAWGLAWYVVWLLSGFHITEWYTGDTGLYSDYWTNAFWEVGGWAWFVFGFWFLERKGLTRWVKACSQRVK